MTGNMIRQILRKAFRNTRSNAFRNCDTPIPSSIQRLSVKLSVRLCTAAIGLCIISCSSPAVSDSKPIASPTPATPSPTTLKPVKIKPIEELGQYLPITATAMIVGRELQLEVANTPSQQAQGLMFRPPLADDRGMLFPFTPARPVAFWMKNTPSPLDIIFLLDGEVKAIARNATTCKTDPCPIYPENGVVADNVLEVRAGLTKELGLQEGDRITINFLLPKNQ
ncbi:MAG: DUF192 domain-containing protein [Pseudanabaena sp. ELA645]|jgi:uncharacterized membrane protein (UPF0127 family)